MCMWVGGGKGVYVCSHRVVVLLRCTAALIQGLLGIWSNHHCINQDFCSFDSRSAWYLEQAPLYYSGFLQL